MLKLSLHPTCKPNPLILARKHFQHHALAPISRMTASVSQFTSNPSEVPTRRIPTLRADASKSVRPNCILRSATATMRTTASVSHLALDQLNVVELSNYPSRQLRQRCNSEDASLTGFGRIIENPAILKLFATESAKHRACVDVADMLQMVSGSVFRTVLKQLPDFCVALNSLTRECAKPLAFMDAMSGGGPHSKPWIDHENLGDGEKESTANLVSSPSLFDQ